MAFGKWCMYFSGVMFLIIGGGALVVALVPSLTEQFVDNATGDPSLGFGAAAADTVRLTAWILAATFIPGAFLFFWVGRWFKSSQPGFGQMMQQSNQMMQQAQAYMGAMNPQANPMPGATAPGATVPGATGPPMQDPLQMPTDPTQGGFG